MFKEKVVKPDRVENFDDFLYRLILELEVEAIRFGADTCKEIYEKYTAKYVKRKHPKSYNWRIGEPLKRYKCPKCGYFHSWNYVRKGVPPVKCARCRTPMVNRDGKETNKV